jgi:hypothetical protein
MITPLLTIVTVSLAFHEVFTTKAYEPVESEVMNTPELIVNVTCVLPAEYPETFAVLSV